MSLRDEFWTMVLWNQKNRDSVSKVSGWQGQFNEINKRYGKLVEINARLKADLQTANNKIVELEHSIAKLTRPKRKYVRHKPLKKKEDK